MPLTKTLARFQLVAIVDLIDPIDTSMLAVACWRHGLNELLHRFSRISWFSGLRGQKLAIPNASGLQKPLLDSSWLLSSILRFIGSSDLAIRRFIDSGWAGWLAGWPAGWLAGWLLAGGLEEEAEEEQGF